MCAAEGKGEEKLVVVVKGVGGGRCYCGITPTTHTHLPLWSINFMANPSADWVLKVKAPSLRVCKHDPAARPQRRTWPFKRALFIREPFLLNYSTGNPALPVSSLSFSSPSAL